MKRDRNEKPDAAWEGPRVVRRVKKRDGRTVVFDAGRIESAVRRAQTAVGENDPLFAEEVAQVVSLALGARHAPTWEGGAGPAPEPGVPEIEEIQDLVEQALIEMGRARVAKAFILYRDRRSRARAALRVHAGERPEAALERGTEVRGLMVRDREGTSAWSRGRIVAALMDEADLMREVAEDVAERVEDRVFDAGLRRLSTGLVRELVDNELLAMGLANALRRHEPISVARHDLRELFVMPPRQPADGSVDYTADDHGATGVVDDVASEVLERYALEDIFDERLADMHRSGVLHFEDVTRPHLVLTRAVPAELLLRREVSLQTTSELLGEIALLLRATATGIVLEDVHTVLAPLRRGAGADDLLRAFLRGLGALARCSGRRLDLGPPGGRSGTLLGRLLVASAGLALEGAAAPRLFLSYTDLSAALGEEDAVEAAETLLEKGRICPVWNADDERWAAPGCRRRPKEKVPLACAGAVAVNVPRVARQVGAWREDLLFGELASAVAAALDALESLDAFQREHTRGEPMRERRAFALTPVGLAEALRILGDGELRPEQGARLLGVLGEATRRFSEERGLSVVLSPFFGARARERFAALDALAPRASQARLFAGLPAPEDERGALYSSGYQLPPAAGTFPGEAEARLLATVRSGALFPFSKPEAATRADAARPALAAWERFHALRCPTTTTRGDTRRPARPDSLFAGHR